MKELLNLCHDMEVRTAEIYGTLCRNDGLGLETAAIFARLEEEEKRHAERVLKASEQIHPPWEEATQDLAEVRPLALHTDEILATFRKNPVADLEALRIMKWLELRYWDLHHHNYQAYQPMALKDLFIELAREENGHITLLSEHFMKLRNTHPLRAGKR